MRHARRAVQHLKSRDRRLAAVIEQVGDLRLTPQRCTPFESLARAIVYQQLSGKAAATIFGRLAARCEGEVAPERLAALPDAALRACGISSQKLGYLRDLTARTRAGALPLEGLRALEDEEIVAALTEVKGIGRWSAEMFLIFYLNRPDVLPVGDLGIRKAAQRLYRLRAFPEPERLLRLGEPWRPFRTVASWYLWRSLDAEAAIGT